MFGSHQVADGASHRTWQGRAGRCATSNWGCGGGQRAASRLARGWRGDGVRLGPGLAGIAEGSAPQSRRLGMQDPAGGGEPPSRGKVGGLT